MVNSMANKIKYGGKYISFKQAVMNETGMSAEQYTKEYDVYKHKVRNWNRATGNFGTEHALSPSETFYYYKKAQVKGYQNDLGEAIANVSSATSKKIPSNAFDIVVNRDRIAFHDFMYKKDKDGSERQNRYSQSAILLFELYDKEQITATQLHQTLLELADGLKQAIEDGMIGSE